MAFMIQDTFLPIPTGRYGLTSVTTWPSTHYSFHKKDLIPILETSSVKYRCGDISSSGKNVCSQTMENIIHSIGQALDAMGANYPWINSEGALYIHIKFQYRAYYKQETPPNRIKLVPIHIICHITSVTAASANEDIK